MRWRTALLVVLSTRLGVWFAAALALLVSIPRRNPLLEVQSWHPDPFPADSLLSHLLLLGDRWDARWYLGIARDGYGETVREAAFFPLYPLLVTAVERLGVPLVPAATLVSVAAAVACVWLLFRIACRKGSTAAQARLAVVLWCVWPAAVVLGAAYPESLTALAISAAWWLALNRRYRLSGLCAGLAILSKPLGIAALPLVLLEGRAGRERLLRTLGPWQGAAIACLVAAAWPAWLAWRFGSPWRFIEAQAGWGRSGTWLGPIDGLWRGVVAALEGVRAVTTGPVDVSRTGVPNFGDDVGLGMQSIVGIVVLSALLALSLMAWRALGAGPGLAALACCVVPLASASSDVPLMSAPRFALLALPCFVVAGQLLTRRHLATSVVLLSSLGLGAAAAGWATWQWMW